MAKLKKTALTAEEAATFRAAMRDVKPFTQTKIPLTPPKPQRRRAPSQEDAQPAGFEFSDHETLLPVTRDEIIQFARSGIQHKMLRKLRQGQYNTEAILDLHGKTIENARKSLSAFLQLCEQNKWQHVLIIHGKGRDNNKPILKNKLNHWLRQTNQVIAFCSALPKDGHSGALYVLLRR